MEYRADGADRRIQPFGDLAVGALQPARFHQRSVELVGEPRSIRAERLNPHRQLILVAVGLAPPLDRAFQRVQRRHQTPRRGFNVSCSWFGVTRTVDGAIAHDRQRTFRKPAAQQNPRFGKRLGREIYVASEPSATPLQSYAPLSNFSPLRRVAPPWTPGIQMLSSPDFPLPQACAEAFALAPVSHPAPHFRRISS